MKIAIISDIHSNLESLKRVIVHINHSQAEMIVCCGDIIGYGPEPEECICTIRGLKRFFSVLGNHDAVVSGRVFPDNFNDYALDAIEKNIKAMSEDSKKYISGIEETLSISGMLFVHGSPLDPINEYLDTSAVLKKNIFSMRSEICFCGHTHRPSVYSQYIDSETRIFPSGNQEIYLEPEKKYIINVGSVGQPRDCDNRSCFAYFDTETRVVSFVRCEYDINSVQKKMTALNFADYLIKRISAGR